MSALAIIPARGGSKGLPRKNVRPFCGKPLIAWAIEAAQQAETVGRIVVSTDDPEIADVSRRFGAEVIVRPREMSGDTSPSEAALLHALRELGARRGVLAFLQCTAPLTLPEDVDGTVAEIRHADSAFTAALGHRFEWRRTPEGAVPVGHQKAFRPMRQQMGSRYVEVGAVYAMRIEAFLEARNRFPGRTAVYPIPPERSAEIDDETDFLLAETLMQRRIERDRSLRLPRKVEAVVMDFDGVLTDNRVTVDEDGRESVTCHRGDGWAVQRLREAGIRLLVLTNESNRAVKRRCEKLNVECVSAPNAKLPLLKEWLELHRIRPESTLYVGNDEPDVPCLAHAGCGVAPADAHPCAKRAARVVLASRGGHGCIRELADYVLSREEAQHATSAHRR